jgi:hypothetical protein
MLHAMTILHSLRRAVMLCALVAPTTILAQAPSTIHPLNINSDGVDYAPTITADGRTLYFCSDRDGGPGGHDLWMARKDGVVDGAFLTPTALGEPVNTDANEGVASISADGRQIYFTACNRDDALGDCDIYVADLVDGIPVNMRNLRMINSPYWDSQPTISADGSTLCFVSNRVGAMGGVGDIDIYVATLQPDGSWSAAQNMGAPINTHRREDSPFLHSGGELLYYSTSGYESQGGLDFVVSRRNADGTWGHPENLGLPINSSRDERFITVPASGREIYFSSERTDVANEGKLDIFVATSIASRLGESNGPSKTVLAVIVAPNPAAERLVVSLVSDSTQPGATHEMHISDMAGREISRSTFTGDRTEVQLDTYANGAYIVKVDGRAARFVVKK